jgi:hypothetical protein
VTCLVDNPIWEAYANGEHECFCHNPEYGAARAVQMGCSCWAEKSGQQWLDAWYAEVAERQPAAAEACWRDVVAKLNEEAA